LGGAVKQVKPEIFQEEWAKDIDPARVPRHVAIIMDGNGRWATLKGLPRVFGHKQGYQTVRWLVRTALDLGIGALTLYTFSSENWKRPSYEVQALMRLIRAAARRELAELHENGVKVLISGRLHELPDKVREQLEHNMEVTKNNTNMVLNLAINYGGRTEIVDAAKAIAEKAARGEISADQIDEKLISQNMYSPEIPDPELVIRTAGELRVSNFLLWEIAYSEIWVTPTLWPDFSKQALGDAIRDFQRRKRKFGGLL
jgi:undecaprenyl diphosphate synthase